MFMFYIFRLWLFINASGTGQTTLALAVSPSHRNLSMEPVVSRKANGRYKEYYFDKSAVSAVARSNDKSPRVKILQSAIFHVKSAFCTTFLPSVSVSDNNNANATEYNQLAILSESGYVRCIFLDNLQYLSRSLLSVLATQRVLEGVGVGRSGATALSATLNFLIRDLSGMMGKLLFTSIAANSFRRNIKRWKYFSEIMMDIGIALEVLAPSFESLFLPLICLGTVSKAVSKVASAACVPGLQMFWAIKLAGSEQAISDVSVKSGAQRTVTGGVGMILAGLVARWLDSSNGGDQYVWICLFCGLTLLNLVCNWMSLKLVTLDWFNGWRLHRVVNEFLMTVDNFEVPKCTTPKEMSAIEPIMFLPKFISDYPIRFGVSFNQLAKLSTASPSSLQRILATKQNFPSEDNYVLKVGKNRQILVSFLTNCSNEEKTKAYLHACLTGHILAGLFNSTSDVCNEQKLIQTAEEVGREKMKKLWPIFKGYTCQAGWKLGKTEFTTEGYEIC